MTHDPQPLERGLREASDSLVATLDELATLEQRKRSLAPGSPEFVELAGRVESLATLVLAHSRAQGSLADAASIVANEVEPRPIDEIPPRSIHAVLADWRAVEREMEQAEPGSPEHDRLSADVTRLRDEYRRAREQAERETR
jgi:hypothetical protein